MISSISRRSGIPQRPRQVEYISEAIALCDERSVPRGDATRQSIARTARLLPNDFLRNLILDSGASDFCLLNSPTLEFYFCLYDLRKLIVTHGEAQILADPLHAVVV